jgi:signal transduction histidine kinase
MRLCVSQIKNWFIDAFSCKWNAYKYQSELMERLSHELRTSLTGVVGYSEFVESTSTEPMINFTAKIIRESSQSLVRSSNSFFDLHRLQLGQVQLDCVSFSVNELVREVVRLNQKNAHELNVNLVFSCANDTFHVEMIADENRVRQVVDALVIGAVQSAGKGKSIHIDLFLADEKDALKLVITSSGVPVDATQTRLLQEFWSSNRYKFRLQEGPGVEMAFAKAMIYFLRGQAEYKTTPNQHSKLIVTLPMHFNKAKVSL